MSITSARKPISITPCLLQLHELCPASVSPYQTTCEQDNNVEGIDKSFLRDTYHIEALHITIPTNRPLLLALLPLFSALARPGSTAKPQSSNISRFVIPPYLSPLASLSGLRRLMLKAKGWVSWEQRTRRREQLQCTPKGPGTWLSQKSFSKTMRYPRCACIAENLCYACIMTYRATALITRVGPWSKRYPQH